MSLKGGSVSFFAGKSVETPKRAYPQLSKTLFYPGHAYEMAEIGIESDPREDSPITGVWLRTQNDSAVTLSAHGLALFKDLLEWTMNSEGINNWQRSGTGGHQSYRSVCMPALGFPSAENPVVATTPGSIPIHS